MKEILSAIHCKCVECQRGNETAVRSCDDNKCSLFPYKDAPQKKVMNLSPEERKRRGDRFRAYWEKHGKKKEA